MSYSSCLPLPAPPVPSLAAPTTRAMLEGWLLRAKGLLCFGAGGVDCRRGTSLVTQRSMSCHWHEVRQGSGWKCRARESS